MKSLPQRIVEAIPTIRKRSILLERQRLRCQQPWQLLAAEGDQADHKEVGEETSKALGKKVKVESVMSGGSSRGRYGDRMGMWNGPVNEHVTADLFVRTVLAKRMPFILSSPNV